MRQHKISFADTAADLQAAIGESAVILDNVRSSSVVPVEQPHSNSLLRMLDRASLAFSRGMTTWATAGRLRG